MDKIELNIVCEMFDVIYDVYFVIFPHIVIKIKSLIYLKSYVQNLLLSL